MTKPILKPSDPWWQTSGQLNNDAIDKSISIRDEAGFLAAVSQFFEGGASGLGKGEMMLIRNAFLCLTQLKGTIGAETVAKVLKGTHRLHNHHPAHGSFRESTYSLSEIKRLADHLDVVVWKARKMHGDAFGPDHTFHVTSLDKADQDAINDFVNGVYDRTPGCEPDFSAPAPSFTRKDAAKLSKAIARKMGEVTYLARPFGKDTTDWVRFVSSYQDGWRFVVSYELVAKCRRNNDDSWESIVAELEIDPRGSLGIKHPNIRLVAAFIHTRDMTNFPKSKTVKTPRPDILGLLKANGF